MITQEELKLYNQLKIDIANYYGVHPEAIQMRNTKRKPTQARNVLVYLLYKYFDLKSEKISDLINRNRIVVTKKATEIENEITGRIKNEQTIEIINQIKSTYSKQI